MELEKDLIKRQLDQLARGIARLLKRAQGGGGSEIADMLDELDKSGEEALGVPMHFLDAAEPASAVVLLRTREKAEAYAQLLEARAQLSEHLHDVASAQALRTRAQAVRTGR